MPYSLKNDRLFWACAALYFINRFFLKSVFSAAFFHSYLNDLICVPIWIPVMITLMKSFGLRDDDSPPHAFETLIAIVIWSIVFEILLPETVFFQNWATSDHQDILFYALGGVIATIYWQWIWQPHGMIHAQPVRTLD